MAHGFSDLQVLILARAASNQGRGVEGVHVYGCEVAADYFGWPLPCADFYDRESGRRRPRLRGASCRCRRPPGLSREQGNRIHATICRSFRRLETCGLGERVSGEPARWSGFRLSDEGVKVARQAEKYMVLMSSIERGNREDEARSRTAPRGAYLWLDTPGAAKQLGIPVERMKTLIGKALVRITNIPLRGSDPLVLVSGEDIERVRQVIEIVGRD
jgi:hypothetical protein